MPKFHAEEDDADTVRETLAGYEGLNHLRVRRRSDLVVIESGPKKDPIPHARFRRVAVHIWVLEMATHNGRWQPSGERGLLEKLVETLITQFGWVLMPVV
jgi:hypothetical protein